MRRPIGWIDNDFEGGRREVRVTFHGNTIKWQFLPEGAEEWEYTTAPTEENWRQLEQKLKDLWQRGHICKTEMAMVTRRCPPPDDQYKKNGKKKQVDLQ